MAEGLSWLVLGLVLVALAGSVLRQFSAGPGGRWADALALAPQWKFFAQDRVGTDPAVFDDWHVLARLAPADPALPPGAWQPLVWAQDRRWWQAVWNPGARRRDALLALAERLAQAEPHNPAQPTALAYLALLRAALAGLAPGPGLVVQFAVAATRGRGARGLRLGFVSAWHVP